jgi:nucleoside-diphosphate-sugar epimerase
MKYFMTGATGFIGGRLAKQLREAGHEVVALARDPEKAGALRALGVTLAEGDVTDRGSLDGPMAGCDGVFHVAAWYKIGARDRKQAWAINVEGTRNVLQAMRAQRIPKGVYTSTLAVFSDTHGELVDETYRYDGPHLSEYDRTKWAAHYEVALPMMREGLPLVIVQPGVVYGPGDTSAVSNAFRQYLAGKLPAVPRGSEYCWAFVEDVARGHVLAMEKGTPGESYIIAGERLSLSDAFKLSERITGVKAPSVQIPPWVLRAMALSLRPVNAVFTLPETYHPETLRAGAGVTYLGDNAKAKRELGYSPRGLEEGLRATLPSLMAEMGTAKA